MKVNAARNLKEAKDDFSEKVASLTDTVAKDARHVDSEIKRLAGIEEANDIKNAQGRAELRKISQANRLQMKEAVRDAVHKGEQRAIGIEKKLEAKNKKTQKVLTARITAEIGTLTKSIHSQIAELALESKEARALMRKEVLAAITEASALAKKNLKTTIAWAEGQFSALDAKLAAEEKKSSTERASLKATIAADKAHAMKAIENAVAAQSMTLVAFQQETNDKIAKTNNALDAQAQIMAKNAKAVKAQMAANTAAIDASLEQARKAAVSQLEAVSAASAARYNKVVKSVSDGIKAATKAAQARVNKHVDEEMARIEAKSNAHHTANIKARGVIRDIMNQNKAAAAAEVKALSKRANADIKKARAEQAALLKSFKKDLTHATDGLYEKLSSDEVAQNSAMAALNKKLHEEQAATAASLKAAKALFASKVNTLTNAI